MANRWPCLGYKIWGTRGKSFKYGRLDSALEGVEEIPNKILLSHDPSHWDAQIRPEFPEIQLTLGWAYPWDAVWH